MLAMYLNWVVTNSDANILYPIMNFYQYNSYEEKTSPKIINSKIFPTANLGPNVSYIFVMSRENY